MCWRAQHRNDQNDFPFSSDNRPLLPVDVGSRSFHIDLLSICADRPDAPHPTPPCLGQGQAFGTAPGLIQQRLIQAQDARRCWTPPLSGVDESVWPHPQAALQTARAADWDGSIRSVAYPSPDLSIQSTGRTDPSRC